MYLVLLVHGMDDWPCLITEDRAKAESFAAQLGPDVPEAILNVFGMDTSNSNPVCVKIVTFGVFTTDGMKPSRVELVKDFN
jgi:hypothetical protein